MLHPREAEAIKPDYSKSVLQTYEEVVMIGIEHTRTLDVLGACSLQESQINWPSWVPHFDVVSSCSDLPSVLQAESRLRKWILIKVAF